MGERQGFKVYDQLSLSGALKEGLEYDLHLVGLQAPLARRSAAFSKTIFGEKGTVEAGIREFFTPDQQVRLQVGWGEGCQKEPGAVSIALISIDRCLRCVSSGYDPDDARFIYSTRYPSDSLQNHFYGLRELEQAFALLAINFLNPYAERIVFGLAENLIFDHRTGQVCNHNYVSNEGAAMSVKTHVVHSADTGRQSWFVGLETSGPDMMATTLWYKYGEGGFKLSRVEDPRRKILESGSEQYTRRLVHALEVVNTQNWEPAFQIGTSHSS